MTDIPARDIAWRDEGSGPAVVLLHGFPFDGSMWNAQVPDLLEAGWRVLVPDLPGFGRSAPVTTEPSLTSVVGALVQGLLRTSVDRCVLVGLSLGGYLIMEWLRQHPEMVAAIALCDTKASADSEEARAARLAMAAAVDQDPSSCAAILRERLAPIVVGHTTIQDRPAVVDAVRTWLDSADPRSVSWYQRAMAARPDSRSVLADCDLPALVVWGSEDVMAPQDEQDVLIDVLHRGRFAVIPGAGHMSAVERPDQVNAELVEFLTTVRRMSADN